MATPLEEKDAIREVMARYCFALDDGRFADMAALFTEDGTWHTFFGKATGRRAIADFAAGLRAHRPGQSSGQPTPRAIHHVTNIVITLDGDSAKVRSNWTTVQNSPDGPKIGSGGAYDDDMVKVGGQWFFRYRTIDRYIRPENE
ncbi:MAG TPA: nuclear transport factor 2 family protein [Stellaceae bacterium]|nr:nuclear transport factor 2 family protein [Stellaceae bacterium]